MVRTAKRTPLIHAGRAFVLALAAGLVLAVREARRDS